MKHAVRWIAIIALFTIPFLPLYVANNLFFPFITGKNFAFRILVEIAFSSYVLLALMDRRYRPRFSWTLVVFGGLVAWMALANLMGVHPHKAFWSNYERMDGWVTLIHLFLFFLVAAPLLTVERLWRRWWVFFVSVAALVCGYGIIQLMGGAEIHQSGMRVDASFGNAIYAAVYLMFSIFVAAWLAVDSRGWLRYSLIAFMGLAAIMLFFTASRGPLIGLIAGASAGALLWLVLSWREKVTSQGVRIAGATIAIIVLLAGGLYAARNSTYVQESPALSRVASVFSLNRELAVRSTIWGIALKGVAEDPITGWGQEGFNQVFNKYYDPVLYGQETWFDRAHNMYLDYMVAGGIPAFLLFVALLLISILALLRSTVRPRAERVLIASALIAYAVQALVVFDNLFSYVPLVMLFAMAHAMSAKPITRVDALPELKSPDMTGFAAAGIGVVAVIAIWMVNVPSIRAAHHLVYALSPSANPAQNLTLFKEALADGSFGSQEIREHLTAFAGRMTTTDGIPTDIRTAFTTLAIEEMGKEVALSPNDARLRVQYATAYDAAGQDEESIKQIEAATALSPRKPHLYINKGFKLNDLGKNEEAHAAFAYAHELNSTSDSLSQSVAAGYLVSGDVAGGKALLLEATGTTTPDDDTIFYAYYQAKQWPELVAVAQARVAATNSAPAARYRLVQAFAAARRFELALTELNATIAANPSTRAEGEALKKRIFMPAQ